MASLSDLLIARDTGRTQQGVDAAGSLQEGVAAGVQLATAKEQIESKKLQVEQQKEQLNQAKFQSFDNMMKTLNRASGNPAVAKQIAKGMKARFQQLGFDPAIVDITVSDPEFGRLYQNMSDLMGGKILGNSAATARALQSAQDAGMLAESLTGLKGSLDRQQQTKIEQMGNDSAERIAAMQLEGKEKAVGAKEEKEDRQALRLSVNAFEGIIKKDREAIGSLKDASNLLSTGGPIEQSAARRALAKAYNSGALTDNDVNDFAGDKSLAERFKQMLSTNLEGEITENNLKQLLQIAAKSAERRQSTVEANAKDAASRYANIYGGDADELYKGVFLPQEFMKGSSPKTEIVSEQDRKAMQTVNPATGKNYTAEEIKAYKASKGIK